MVEVLIEFVVHQAAFAAHQAGAIFFKVWHRILHAVYHAARLQSQYGYNVHCNHLSIGNL